MLVLDANILIRAARGSRVLSLLRKYAERVEYLAPDTAFQEASEHLLNILSKRGISHLPALDALDLVSRLVQVIGPETYAACEFVARQRLDRRDADDWPVRSGQKTQTSSAAVWPPGQRTSSNSIWRISSRSLVRAVVPGYRASWQRTATSDPLLPCMRYPPLDGTSSARLHHP